MNEEKISETNQTNEKEAQVEEKISETEWAKLTTLVSEINGLFDVLKKRDANEANVPDEADREAKARALACLENADEYLLLTFKKDGHGEACLAARDAAKLWGRVETAKLNWLKDRGGLGAKC